MQVIAFCRENGIHCIAGVEPDQPEDVSDIDRALNPRPVELTGNWPEKMRGAAVRV